jgi:biogenesis of lysosome-related organelles complex 1 subunit 2
MADGSKAPPATGMDMHMAKTHTLSTSTSSFEALDPHDPHLSHLAAVMCQKTADWIHGEFEATYDDYRLLEQMNL